MNNKKKLIIIGILLIFVIFISIIFSIANMGYTKIHKNISISSIDVAHLEKSDAEEKVKKTYREKQIDGIILKHNDFEINLSYEQLGISPDFDSALQKAYGIGRTGNIITNNYALIFVNFIKRNIDINFNINEKNLNLCIDDIESKLPDLKIDESYSIEENELIISKGKEGVSIQKEQLKKLIIDNIENLTSTDNIIEIPVSNESPKEINIEQIASEIKKEPQDAYLSKNPLEVHADEDGIELGISIDEAKQILEEDKDEYILPLNITKLVLQF